MIIREMVWLDFSVKGISISVDFFAKMPFNSIEKFFLQILQMFDGYLSAG